MRYRRARSPAARTSFASFNKANRKLYENKQTKSLAAWVSNTHKIMIPNPSSVEISKATCHFTYIKIIHCKPWNFTNVIF